MLEVDHREDEKIFKYLEKIKFPFERKQLTLGDYLDSEKNICVERKEALDFLQSYTSGHLQKQLTDIDANYEEGYLFISGATKQFFESMYFNSSLPTYIKRINRKSYDKMKIHLSKSFSHIKIIEFYNDHDLVDGVIELFTYTGNKRITQVVRLKSSKEDVLLAQICCVPGIGVEKAKKILEKYKPRDLYQIDETALKNIDGIGPKIAEKIKEVFK